MKLSFVTILFVASLASIYGIRVKRSTDVRCDAVPGIIPVEFGCMALFIRYTYIKATNSCEEYIYSGCGGSANNFLTQEECEKACKH